MRADASRILNKSSEKSHKRNIEICTDADDSSSTSAKRQMLYAAQTLDRMVSDLERRLEKN